MGQILSIIIIVLIIYLLLSNIRIVPQEHAYVIERLGKFKTVWYAGLHVKIPFIDNMSTYFINNPHLSDKNFFGGHRADKSDSNSPVKPSVSNDWFNRFTDTTSEAIFQPCLCFFSVILVSPFE